MFRKHAPNVSPDRSNSTSPPLDSKTSPSNSTFPPLSLTQERSDTLSDHGDSDHQTIAKRKRKS